jgi:hypothetical protein
MRARKNALWLAAAGLCGKSVQQSVRVNIRKGLIASVTSTNPEMGAGVRVDLIASDTLVLLFKVRAIG